MKYGFQWLAFAGLSGSLLVGYFVGCIPYIVMDALRLPFLEKYKVQVENYPTTEVCILFNRFNSTKSTPFLCFSFACSCDPLLIFSDAFFIKQSQFRVSRVLVALFVILMFPMIAAFVIANGILNIRSDLTLPSLIEVVVHIAFFFVVEDFMNYWFHRWLHAPWAYKHIHYVHHEHTSPFALAASYAHPAEVIILGIPTLFGPMIVAPHLFTLWLWMMMRQFEAIDIHSGYELPWNMNRLFRFYAGTEHHDFHHHMFSGNFSSTFTWCDKLYGTSLGYDLFQQKKLLDEEVHPKSL